MSAAFVLVVVVAVFVVFVVAKTAVVVPQQSAFVVERLGRFSGVLEAGFHVLMPFMDIVRYKHTLKEQSFEIPEQICITRDNVQVAVDGILYLKVMDPQRASYGISDYNFAITQLAQTALRSEIGKIDLDRTFEERTHINTQVVSELDKATGPWGIKVLRYEIKNITPPKDILAAIAPKAASSRSSRSRRRSGSSRSTRPRGRRSRSSRWPRLPPRGSPRWVRRCPGRAAWRRCSSGWPSST